MSMKNPLTPAGIEPATYRFVAQHLNHRATAIPSLLHIYILNTSANSLYVKFNVNTTVNSMGPIVCALFERIRTVFSYISW